MKTEQEQMKIVDLDAITKAKLKYNLISIEKTIDENKKKIILSFVSEPKENIYFDCTLYFMKSSKYFENIKTNIPIDKLELHDQKNIKLIEEFNKTILDICLDKEIKSFLKQLF